jgi:hypothetical protein
MSHEPHTKNCTALPVAISPYHKCWRETGIVEDYLTDAATAHACCSSPIAPVIRLPSTDIPAALLNLKRAGKGPVWRVGHRKGRANTHFGHIVAETSAAVQAGHVGITRWSAGLVDLRYGPSDARMPTAEQGVQDLLHHSGTAPIVNLSGLQCRINTHEG